MNLTSESTKEISKALSIAQSKITNVTKDKTGYGYKYADLGACLEIIRLPLAENELSFVQLPSILESGHPVLISMVLHSSGEWIRSIFHLNAQGSKQMNDTQALGSAVTYLRRYALCAMFGIAQEDDDGQSAQNTKQEEDLEKKVNHFNPVKQLVALCASNQIDLVEFTKFHKIKSDNPENVKHSVANFKSLLNIYKEKIDA